ncbi:MAG TPA: ABC transporter ATP-binding protein [Chloroflexaceae bacterium]|nr:ABC transporter ATP-binding protein [Chloroflexaceae bacterium]
MIAVNELSYTYPGAGRPAISGLSFAVAPGEIFGFLGPSGAGKSTTQKILMKLLRGYAGEVRAFGRDLASWGADYYERVGVGFELPNHFLRLSARRNLAYFAALYSGPTRPADELLALLGLADAADTPVEQFSKGMQTRLGIARALLHRPELIFLDEPTTGLDPVSGRMVKELIRAQRDEGRTVVLTTHNMALADELCDRVALIVDGRIAQIDAPRALRLRYGAPRVRVEYVNGSLHSAEFPLEGLADNGAFQRLLRDTSVQTIHSREATLEDVFIAVTGRSLS